MSLRSEIPCLILSLCIMWSFCAGCNRQPSLPVASPAVSPVASPAASPGTSPADSPPAVLTESRPDSKEWVDGGYLGRADIFVCCSDVTNEKAPWVGKPNVYDNTSLEKIALQKGWSRVTAEKVIQLQSAHPIQLVIARISDDRWTRYLPLKANITADRVELLISLQKFTGVRIQNYMPSLWSVNTRLTALKPGQTYDIYLGQTFQGKISIGGTQ